MRSEVFEFNGERLQIVGKGKGHRAKNVFFVLPDSRRIGPVFGHYFRCEGVPVEEYAIVAYKKVGNE